MKSPKFKVKDRVKWGRKVGEVFGICLKGYNILDAVRFKIDNISDAKLDLGELQSAENRYIIKWGNKYIGFTISKFDEIGTKC